jgi:transcriptional regulator with XRE-family HTH domain
MSTATAPQFSEVTALNLKDLRTQKGLTQAQVADLIGLSHEQVSRIESGQRALSPAEKMVLDARLLGLPL